MSGHTRTEIGQLTQLLRASDDPFWRRLRQLLTAKHIDPSSTIVVQCFPDDQDFEFGIIVTKPSLVFQFGLEYLNRSVEDGTFAKWEDLTDRVQSSPHRDSIGIALEMLRVGA